MTGRPASRIGVDVYPRVGVATGIWRLSELYNRYAFQSWPAEPSESRDRLNLLAATAFPEVDAISFRSQQPKINLLSLDSVVPQFKFSVTYKISEGVVA